MLLRGWIVFLLVCSLTWGTVSADWCPFCSAINLTFTEQIKQNDVVLVAKMTEAPKYTEESDLELPKAEFEVVRVIKGENYISVGMKFKTLLVGTYDLGQEFLIMGVDPPFIVWSTPLKSNPRILEYIGKLSSLPASGGDRLVYFQEYFEDPDSTLAYDAYDEFAVASYADLFQMKDRMKHDKLIEWIQNPDVPINRRRLYFTMLGVCGSTADVPFLESLITSEDRRQQSGLDALIACYLCLKGPDGVTLIEKQFLTNDKVDYVDTLAAISALRFHGTESNIIPKERLVAAIRTMLDRPKLADMVIPDLARWEDWSVMDRLVELFKTADDQNNWLRVPIIQYLQACPKPEAKVAIEELRKIDPEAVKRATFYTDFGFGDLDDAGADKAKDAGGKGGETPKVDDKKIEDKKTETPKTESPKTESGSGKGTTGGGSGGGGGGDETARLSSDEPLKVVVRKVPADISLASDTDPVELAPASNKSDYSVSVAIPRQAGESSAHLSTTNLPEPSDSINVDDSSELTQDSSSATNQTAATNPVNDVLDKGTPGNSIGTRSNQPLNSGSMADSTFVVLPSGNAENADRRGDTSESSNPEPAELGTAPIAQTNSLGWWVVLTPTACGTLLFVLLWSVIHGWFERLVF